MIFSVSALDECSSSPCMNGGVCVDHMNGFTCDCTNSGMTGAQCENCE